MTSYSLQEEGDVEAVMLTGLWILERNFYIERPCEVLVGLGHTWKGLLALGFKA